MNGILKVFILVLLPVMVITGNIQGQVNANGVNAIRKAIYDTTHLIYIYNQTPSARQGVFSAVSPWTGKANFAWSRFDTVAKTFLPPFKTDNNVTTSGFTTLNGGGYRVIIDSAAVKRDTFVFWFYPHKDSLRVLKNNLGKVPYYKYSCKHVQLDAYAYPDTFYYYNPITGNPYMLKNNLIYKWTTDPEAKPLQNIYNPRDNDPPTKNTRYTCWVTDSFNYGPITDYVDFDAVRVKAIFDTISIPKNDTFLIEKSAPNYSAPVKFIVKNTSENATKFTWYWDDNDTTYMDTNADTSHIYYKSRDYNLKLVAEKKDCIDSTIKKITIEPPQIGTAPASPQGGTSSFPNIFIVDGGKFKPKYLSIKSFNFIVFTRWGNKVHQSIGKDFDIWEGWDGMINGKPASEGVYFYVLYVSTYNDKPKGFQDVYKGFVHIYHPK